MYLSFPTTDSDPSAQGGTKILGFPLEARSCSCGAKRLMHDDTCVLCGRYAEHTVRATWAKRAEIVARITKGKGATSSVPIHARQVALDAAHL